MLYSNVKAVIPARFDSTRLPGKPLLELNDKPIFWHVVQRVLESGMLLEDIVLATDDVRIEAKAQELNIPVFMTSKEHVSGTDRVNEVANALGWGGDTLIINVQGDEPLVPSSLIERLIDFSLANLTFGITTAVAAINSIEEFNNPNIVKAIVGENNNALYFTRAAAPFNRDDNNNTKLAYRHIGIYAYTKAKLNQFCQFPEAPLENHEKLEQLRALSNGMSMGVIKLKKAPAHGIDTHEDYLSIKKIMEQ
jgi:3-deoxy-manno-octulosonate cytidylyltransferase (CMP-KDO synthetase)